MITASNDKAIFHPLSSTYPYQDWGGHALETMPAYKATFFSIMCTLW